MKIDQIDEGVGRIVKGVNTTPDVDVDQVSKEAAKFGFKVDKDGRPPLITKKSKNNPNTMFNLGLTEGINPLSWFTSGLANNPEYKAWKRIYDRNPQRAEMTFRKKHKEFLAYYNKEEVTSSKQFTDYEMALMEGGHSIEDLDKPTPSISDLASKHNVPVKQILKQLEMGIEVEYEHTSNFEVAKEIALDHIAEDPSYYDNLKFVEGFASDAQRKAAFANGYKPKKKKKS